MPGAPAPGVTERYESALVTYDRETRWIHSSPVAKHFQWLGKLLADAQFLNDGLVTVGVVRLQVVQQATPLADHHEKAAPGGVILLVALEMIRQFADPLAEDGNLHFRTASVRIMRAELRDDVGFALFR